MLCSTASCILLEYILSGNCSASRHALLSSILYTPGIYSIQELLCSAASRLFRISILSRNCFALHHSVLSRNLYFRGTALLCSILSFPGIYTIQELLYSVASFLFQESILFRSCSALQHPVFSRYLFYQGSALQHPVLSRNYSAKQHPIFSRNRLYPRPALLCSILCYPGIYYYTKWFQYPVLQAAPCHQILGTTSLRFCFPDFLFCTRNLLTFLIVQNNFLKLTCKI